MHLLSTPRGPLPFWLGLVGLVLISLPGMAQQNPISPGFPGGPGPFYPLPNVPITSPPAYYPPPWMPGTIPYPGWNQYWSGYRYGWNGSTYKLPCPGDIMGNPQRIAPSKPGNYNGGTFGLTRTRRDQTLKNHDGLDLMASRGTPFRAVYGGVVTRVERSFTPGQYTEGSYGNFVEVRSVVNGQTVTLKYNHMDGINSEIQLNAIIRAGATIGLSGTTGNAAKDPNNPNARYIVPHVHIQARDATGKPTNPETHLSTKFDQYDRPTHQSTLLRASIPSHHEKNVCYVRPAGAERAPARLGPNHARSLQPVGRDECQ